MKLYIVHYYLYGMEMDTKLLGVYSSEEKALEGIKNRGLTRNDCYIDITFLDNEY